MIAAIVRRASTTAPLGATISSNARIGINRCIIFLSFL
jgi:hypothetical protein